jgi:hypothetical protein
MTGKKMSAFEAMNQAQMIAFYPIVFQAIIATKRLGILEFLKKNKGYNKIEDISKRAPRKLQYWETLFISGGRKDKISKGDIAGLFFKQGNITKDQLGNIELKQDCAFVAVPLTIANDLIEKLNNTRLKKKKVRVTLT